MATKAPTKPKKAAPATRPARRSAAASTSGSSTSRSVWLTRFNRELSPHALLAEMFGTFILVSAVQFTSSDAFFTGITYLVLAFALFAISGSHLNPAVTFALWATRQVSAIRMVFYWLAQFLGALGAIVVMHLFSGTALELSLASFGDFDLKIFMAELVGAGVFMFGFAAAMTRGNSDTSKAVGVGLSLFLGLVMATGLLSQAVQGQAQTSSDTASESRLQKVNNVALNPAVALALTERDTSSTQLDTEGDEEKDPVASRLTLETVLGPLLGAGLGAQLFVLLAAGNYRRND